MSKLLGWFFNLVMRRSLAGFSRDVSRPRAAEARSLKEILARNSGTEFGRRHRVPDTTRRPRQGVQTSPNIADQLDVPT